MDIICHRCREPWEVDTFHEIAKEKGISFTEAVSAFKRKGCEATGWTGQCEMDDADGMSMAIQEIGDLLGDDVDGFANFIEDMRL